LSLRLFGNIFAGGILVALIALFPPWIMWAPNAIWKSFDLFVGAIQAFIFALLTILYFGMAASGHGGDDGHEADASRGDETTDQTHETEESRQAALQPA